MKAIKRVALAKQKGLIRELVRRGSRSDRSPAVARRTRSLRKVTMCEQCGAVFRNKRWLSGSVEERTWPVGLAWTVCPACRQAKEGEYFGRVLIGGGGIPHDEEAIRRRIENVAERARFTQPQRRLVSMERRNGILELLTTSQKLAHRIVRALLAAFGGQASYGWSDRDGELLATWEWGGTVPKAAKRPIPRPLGKRRVAARFAARGPELELQSRHVDIDSRWRDIIERTVAEWAERYPEVLRVHVTLGHGRHHRHGMEEVALAAAYPGRTLRVTKQGEGMIDAIHAGLAALSRKLGQAHQVRRRILKNPGARLEGSIKRIFRDSGYGFIRLDRGREAYFHRNSLHGLTFEALKPGMPVAIDLEEGEDGPQASRVFPVGQGGQT